LTSVDTAASERLVVELPLLDPLLAVEVVLVADLGNGRGWIGPGGAPITTGDVLDQLSLSLFN
jgi:hypothetical protein